MGTYKPQEAAMSGLAMEWAHHMAIDKQLDRTAWLVLLDLADHANVRTGEAWPSGEEIAGRLGMSRRTVQRAFVVIEESGIVEVIHRSGHVSIWRFGPVPPMSPTCDMGVADPRHGCHTEQEKNKVINKGEPASAKRTNQQRIDDSWNPDLTAACRYCDPYGWLSQPDGSVVRCTHRVAVTADG